MKFYGVYCKGNFLGYYDTRYDAFTFMAGCRLALYYAGVVDTNVFEIKEEEL